MGHPNEGKSSVVSTLSEDDSVVITPVPGATVACRAYPVMIDGEEIIQTGTSDDNVTGRIHCNTMDASTIICWGLEIVKYFIEVPSLSTYHARK